MACQSLTAAPRLPSRSSGCCAAAVAAVSGPTVAARAGTAAAAAIPPAISTAGPAAVALASLRLRCFRVSCPSAFFPFVPFLLCFLVAGKPK